MDRRWKHTPASIGCGPETAILVSRPPRPPCPARWLLTLAIFRTEVPAGRRRTHDAAGEPRCRDAMPRKPEAAPGSPRRDSSTGQMNAIFLVDGRAWNSGHHHSLICALTPLPRERRRVHHACRPRATVEALQSGSLLPASVAICRPLAGAGFR
ncbi:hypothetical protein N658DRAFT_491093 [Parathielavia hyrcaniae]|uniref:Uncharacterized protein n=1 Tax=Parathielavia hyrcaniae TaxID=113614 RepID=A0AAN6QFH5_9PEZI|nr:hypothetical protein N658DRAFT_491093 [Parathielavia hyrcaniae]